MGWNSDYTLLTAPISLDDIAQVAGTSAPYNLGYMIKYGSAPNMWAKWKPFKSSIACFDTTTQAGQSARNDAAASVNYGIGIPVESSFGDPTYGFLYKLLNSQLMWYYDRPTAGEPTEWFRSLDFDGYFSNARSLTNQLVVTSYTLDSVGNLTIQWPATPYDPSTDYQIRPNDLKIGGVDLTQCYFGALIYYDSTHYTWAAPSTYALVGAQVTFTQMSWYEGKNVQIVPFISTVQINQGIGPGAAVVLASWNLAPIQIAISRYVPNWSVAAGPIYWNPANTSVYYDITVTNNTNIEKTMEFEVWLTDSTDNYTNTLAYAFHLVTVAANSSMALTGTLGWVRDTTLGYKVKINGSYGGENVPTSSFNVMSVSPVD